MQPDFDPGFRDAPHSHAQQRSFGHGAQAQLYFGYDALLHHAYRGFMARYFMVHGDYHSAAFAFGTALTFAKEVIRIAAVDRHFKTGLPALVRGWRDSHAIFHDSSWQPMPALEENAVQPGFDRLTMAEGSHPWGGKASADGESATSGSSDEDSKANKE